MPGKSKQILGHQLSPEILERIGETRSVYLPSAEGTGAPSRRAYRIWTNHGYDEAGNFDAGSLVVETSHDERGRPLIVATQRIALWDGMISEITGCLICQCGLPAMPVEWTVQSRFTDSGGVEIPDLGRQQAGDCDGAVIREKNGERARKRRVEGPWTCDWCLFDVAPRLLEGGGDIRCRIIERMFLERPKQHVIAHPDLKVRLAGAELRCVSRSGTGVLPHQYWVDATGTVVLLIAYNMAYLLERDAEARCEELIAERGGAQG